MLVGEVAPFQFTNSFKSKYVRNDTASRSIENMKIHEKVVYCNLSYNLHCFLSAFSPHILLQSCKLRMQTILCLTYYIGLYRDGFCSIPITVIFQGYKLLCLVAMIGMGILGVSALLLPPHPHTSNLKTRS